jgi:ABC-type nitrate/sulfonate/bicarbonate transport system substrate-binding protein
MKNRFTMTMIVVGPVLLLIIIAGFLWQSGFLTPQSCKSAGTPTKINVGTALNSLSGLLYVAQDQGFDKECGLEIHLKPSSSGQGAINDLQAGRIDVACCAEFVLVSEVLAGARNLRCFGVFCSGSVHEVIARRDKGISRIEDLRSKNIGVPWVHSARFFLARFLTLHQISLKEINLVDVRPSELADALAGGKVDAVMAWEPLSFNIEKRLDENAVTWPGQEGQDLNWLSVSREDVLQKKRPALEKLEKALSQAAHFAGKNPQAVKEIVSQRTKIPLADLQASKFSLNYGLFLDQALLLAMEDQARWMIQNGLSNQKQVPYFLDYIDADILLKINPRAVRLVLPGKGRTG